MQAEIQVDCVVIGGGAAGLMCAATAGYRGRSVLVIDHANKVGKKILMSGGGRCNFTNLTVDASNYLSNNPHFCKSALSRYTSSDFIELVEQHGVAYHEKTKGQLFCDNKSKDILNLLLEECRRASVDIKTLCDVNSISQRDEGFSLDTSIGKISTHSLVIATGGLSIPTMGATGKGYEIAQQFGLTCTPCQASLVPFILKQRWGDIAKELSGLSVDVEISCKKHSFREALLFTHKGLSGPAILQISNYWNYGDKITVDFLPTINVMEDIKHWQKQGNKSELKNLLSRHLPKRFVQTWLAIHSVNKPVSQYSEKECEEISTAFHQWQIVPPGTEGYRTAEVTRGGVNTNEVSSKTFEAKKVPNLYFVGEVLDVTGWLGGFNFQWAWASGYCAGQYV